MQSREFELKKYYHRIMNSENPFIDGTGGSISIIGYNGGGIYSCLLMTESDEDVLEVDMPIRQLRNFELN